MLLYLSVFTILLSLLLLYNNRNINRNTLFLSSYLLLISLYGITHYFTIYSNSVFWLAFFYSNFSPLMLLMGPSLYFYIRNTLKDQQGLKKYDFIHFVPAIIHFIGQIPYYLKPFVYKQHIAEMIISNVNLLPLINTNYFYSAVFSYSWRTILMFSYVVYCIYIVWKDSSKRLNKSKDLSKQYSLTYKWLIILLFSTLMLVVNFFIITSIGIFEHPAEALLKLYPLHIISLVAFLTMTFSLLFFPTILYGIPIHVNSTQDKVVLVKENTESEVKIPDVKDNKKIVNGNKSVFIENADLLPLYNPDDSLYEVGELIKNYLIKEKPYLDPEFSQFTISVDLKIPLNHISYCFAYIFEKKFNALRMELRVSHAIKLLKGGLSESITIDAISQEAGFSSRSNFYAAFKKITNTTPTDYISENFKD